MAQPDINSFISFITKDKNLTKSQIRKRNALLANAHSGNKPTYTNNDNPFNSNIAFVRHDPTKIVSFLRNFSKNNTTLKYTTHHWDKNREGDYDYISFDDFKNKYTKELSKELPIIKALCEHLWRTIRNFLLNDEPSNFWSDEFKLKIGYNKYVKAWMDANPSLQPFSMPISAFPKEIQPVSLINGRIPVYFDDIVNVFKKCIEFRDNNLYFTVRSVFKKSDFNIDMSALETLRGKTFFTDTENVKNGLGLIANNIFARPEFPELRISCHLLQENEQPKIQLRITQIGSFSDKDLTDPKISANSDIGDFQNIIKKLRNLCDFSIESRFRNEQMEQYLRITYLSSSLQKEQHITEIEANRCDGFTYLLTFPI